MRERCKEAHLFKSQRMDWGVDAGLADEEVVVDDRDMVLRQLDIYSNQP